MAVLTPSNLNNQMGEVMKVEIEERERRAKKKTTTREKPKPVDAATQSLTSWANFRREYANKQCSSDFWLSHCSTIYLSTLIYTPENEPRPS